MDAIRFDTLARSLTTSGSRRRAVAAALGSALGLFGLAHPDDAMAGGACKPACTECQSCKKGKCHKTKHGKKCKKGTCQPTNDGLTCQNNPCRECRGGICSNRASDTCQGTPCKACRDGTCSNKPNETSCNGTGKCLTGVCNAPPSCTQFDGICPLSTPEDCCSQTCTPSGVPAVGNCAKGPAGASCLASTDCTSGSCIAYRCT
jgi:hypothetical protein